MKCKKGSAENYLVNTCLHCFEFSCSSACPENLETPTLIPPLVFLMLFFFDNSASEMDLGGQVISADLLLVAERVKKKIMLEDLC